MPKPPKPPREYHDNPAFHEPNAASLFPAGEPLPILPLVHHLGLCRKLRAASPSTPLTPLKAADERRLFLQYNYARFRVAQWGCDRALWAGRAAHLEDYITRMNLPLVAYMHGLFRTRMVQIDIDSAHGEAMAALLRAVRGFDVGRGLKFSTMATTCIKHAYFGMLTKSLKPKRNGLTRSSLPYVDGVASIAEYHDREFAADADFLGDLINENAADLTEQEQHVIRHRFGLAGAQRMTLDEIGVDFGVSKERIRQIQVKALVKLREALGPTLLVK